MKMLKSLNSIGIFKNDDVWFPTYYTYNTMWNFSDASSKLAKVCESQSHVINKYYARHLILTSMQLLSMFALENVLWLVS